MLLQLNINNFALIESLSISFDKGFNILTGETGAGKSIIIDAINFVLGGKFNKGLIRTGEEKTFVEAIFDVENKNTISLLKEMEIEFEDLVIISRETFKSGKSIVKVNGKSVLISQIKRLAETLINIHGQHENQDLLKSATHILYLDRLGEDKLKNDLIEYMKLYEKLLEIDRKIGELGVNSGEREKLLDFLNYQISEIDKANLKIGEDLELEKRYTILNNAEKISGSLGYAYNVLYNSNDNFVSVYDSLNKVIKELRNVEDKIDTISSIVNSLEEAYYNIEQNISDIRHIQENTSYDKNELDIINSRIFQIDTYKRKYGNSIEEILEYKNKITKQYNEMINSNEIIESLKKDREKICSKMRKIAKDIHIIRKSIATLLEDKIKSELEYVGLEKSIFKVSIKMEEEFYSNGCDKIEFLISTNPGQPIKPLESVVSGGELSRIMLGLKTVFVSKDEIPSIIFDEIDTGISGRTAQRVAEKMYLISKNCQVFCVTHLPQIAAMSDCHFLVSKEVKEERTYTNIKRISETKKEEEIARMIGGSEITDLTIKHSKEMIKLAHDRKIELVHNKEIRN
ncbi:DNA repair protein RecN [Clostridium sp. MB40-C1]|uniref:DNA repair protein RecN n=1 Tax=Clostridium sp. MB40-C1 TaxID=3070996 RepID=UPI0027E0B7EE|nr:DNA repair protein RecN [Clostridium sp. MB40-C1]WMJ81870.1 DNA repair protein RecN [Clostridium sp. MB40-C1]